MKPCGTKRMPIWVILNIFLTREYMADDNQLIGLVIHIFVPVRWDLDTLLLSPCRIWWMPIGALMEKLFLKFLPEETRRARFADMWMKYFAEPVGETYKSVAPAVFREKVPTLDIKSIPYMQEFRNRDSRLACFYFDFH